MFLHIRVGVWVGTVSVAFQQDKYTWAWCGHNPGRVTEEWGVMSMNKVEQWKQLQALAGKIKRRLALREGHFAGVITTSSRITIERQVGDFFFFSSGRQIKQRMQKKGGGWIPWGGFNHQMIKSAKTIWCFSVRKEQVQGNKHPSSPPLNPPDAEQKVQSHMLLSLTRWHNTSWKLFFPTTPPPREDERRRTRLQMNQNLSGHLRTSRPTFLFAVLLSEEGPQISDAEAVEGVKKSKQQKTQ